MTTGAKDETYEDVFNLSDRHFSSITNRSYEQYLVENFKQNLEEKIHQFYIRFKQKCDFGETNSEIK